MALTTAQSRAIWNVVRQFDPTFVNGFVKADLDAATTAVDAWCTSNQASFLAALPAPFTSATAAQKALLLAYVCMKRGGVF